MSNLRTREWLISQKSFENNSEFLGKSLNGKAKTISIASGKGGVGKTSISIKFAKMLSDWGYKVLLIDCDYNLSNTSVKLGLPISDNFFSLLSAEKSFEDCVYKEGNFHLLSGCNGNMDLFDKKLDLDRVIVDIINAHEGDYDFIICDCPAGLSREAIIVNAYCDYRFVVVTPDKSSITDSYSLIKILNTKYGVKENHVLFNKISSSEQMNRLSKTLGSTVDHFLDCKLNVLGGLPLDTRSVDQFDKALLKVAGSKIHASFFKFMKRFTEEDIGAHVPDFEKVSFNLINRKGATGQDVQPNA